MEKTSAITAAHTCSRGRGLNAGVSGCDYSAVDASSMPVRFNAASSAIRSAGNEDMMAFRDVVDRIYFDS